MNPDPVLSGETVLRRIRSDQFTHATGSIHPKAFAGGSVHALAFGNDRGTDRHSVSREKYTSAGTLRNLADEPERFGVAALAVADYEEKDQVVQHTPIPNDLGHCDAIGDKTKTVKNYLRKRASIRIPPPPV